MVRRIRGLILNVQLFWRPVIRYQPWDYSYMLGVWEVMFRDMGRYHQVHGRTVEAPIIGADLLDLADLCTVLRDEDCDRTHEALYAAKARLGLMIGKNLLTWWD